MSENHEGSQSKRIEYIMGEHDAIRSKIIQKMDLRKFCGAV